MTKHEHYKAALDEAKVIEIASKDVVITFYGEQGTGKTTLLTMIWADLEKRGFRVNQAPSPHDIDQIIVINPSHMP